mgnify:CR=1 FL=1
MSPISNTLKSIKNTVDYINDDSSIQETIYKSENGNKINQQKMKLKNLKYKTKKAQSKLKDIQNTTKLYEQKKHYKNHMMIML